MLRNALEGLAPVIGVLRRDAAVETPSRHLGLVPVAERHPEAVATVERLGRLVGASVDLDRVLEIAGTAGDLEATPWSPPTAERATRPLVALAGGPAFTFAYAEMSEALAAAGAEVCVVDPLRDNALPEGTQALVLPGGFPEVYAEQLAANDGFMQSIREHLDAGRPTYAECAGLLLLCKALDGTGMVGFLDATASMTKTLTLGYRTVVAHADSIAAAEGTVLIGHEFHRTTVDPRSGKRPAWQLEEDGSVEGFTSDHVLASYVHLHPAGAPELALRIVAKACSERDPGCT
jgi:cobyrinic acid a,c-diamide synthase